MILDRTVLIKRLQDNASDADKEGYSSIAGLQGVRMNIQPASPEVTAISDGVFGQTYRAYLTQSGVLAGDRITVSGTWDVYEVKGVEDWAFSPLSHYELTLHKGLT